MKSGNTRTQTGHAHRTDALAPGVLMVSTPTKSAEKHFWRLSVAVYRQSA